jgi:hypothetical protein
MPKRDTIDSTVQPEAPATVKAQVRGERAVEALTGPNPTTASVRLRTIERAVATRRDALRLLADHGRRAVRLHDGTLEGRMAAMPVSTGDLR